MSVLKNDYLLDSLTIPKSSVISDVGSPSSRLSDVDGAAKQKAREVFWGLGDDWWKNIIDGYHHDHGKFVFDQGLHECVVEKGFFSSLKSAYQLASDTLMEKPSEKLYKDIHKCACAHFKGYETSTEISADKTGIFRDMGISYAMKKICDKEAEAHYYNFHVLETLRLGKDQMEQVDVSKLERSEAWVKEHESVLPKKLEEVNESILKFSRSFGYSEPLAVVSLESRGKTQIIHRKISSKEVGVIVNKLFSDFNSDIERSTSPHDKLAYIAGLYQHLEWVHPFYDGCGRTNLITLNKLLVEHGFNPAILEKPFMCNFAPFQDWVAYLGSGITAWKREVSKVKGVSVRGLKKNPKKDSPRPKSSTDQYKIVSSHGVIYKKKLTGVELFFHNLFNRK